MNKKKQTCNCSLCNNDIREERQYAAFEMAEDLFAIVDAEEYAHIYRWLEDIKVSKKEMPDYPEVEPPEGSSPILAYGVLIPQYDSDIDDWNLELEKYKEYAFATLSDEKIYLSAYSDYELLEEMNVYYNHIPCALLLDTSIDLSKEREYGFGYTAFLMYSNVGIFDTILNRKFLFCLGGKEKNFDVNDLLNWKKYIDKGKLMEIAKRLF